jgi:hypothetical protein
VAASFTFGILLLEQGDHWTGGLADDLADQLERVIGTGAQTDQGDVGALPGGHLCDMLDVNLASDYLVTERDDYLGKQFEPLPLFVRDQDAQVFICARQRAAVALGGDPGGMLPAMLSTGQTRPRPSCRGDNYRGYPATASRPTASQPARRH